MLALVTHKHVCYRSIFSLIFAINANHNRGTMLLEKEWGEGQVSINNIQQRKSFFPIPEYIRFVFKQKVAG